MTAPTGTHRARPEGDSLVITRTIPAPIDEVWRHVSESDRTERWFGTFTGDPADGHVLVTMNAEGMDDPPAARYDIARCEPQRALEVTATDEMGTWNLVLELEPLASPAAGGATGEGTLVVLSHVGAESAMIENIGPGWEYYLDRLAAAVNGGDPDAVVWDDYYPAMQAYYVGVSQQFPS